MKQIELIEHGRFLGEEFLIWLWMRGLTEGGASGSSGDTSACFLDDEVLLVTERGDVKELSLRKGNPPESLEAFEAISRGMRPYRAKVRILAGDMEWVFSLDAPQLDFSSMKLPPTQTKDLQSRVSDRMFLLEEGTGHLERRFALFLARRSKDPDGLIDEMKAWVAEGLAQANSAQG
jgi:recombination associated protein RdgC